MENSVRLLLCNGSPILKDHCTFTFKGGIANKYDENGNEIESEDEDDY